MPQAAKQQRCSFPAILRKVRWGGCPNVREPTPNPVFSNLLVGDSSLRKARVGAVTTKTDKAFKLGLFFFFFGAILKDLSAHPWIFTMPQIRH